MNYTPHTINVQTIDGSVTSYKSDGIARVSTVCTPVGDIDGIPLQVTRLGEVCGLPPEEDGVFIIVSGMVLEAADRRDLVAPATGPDDQCIRDGGGRIVAITKFNTRY